VWVSQGPRTTVSSRRFAQWTALYLAIGIPLGVLQPDTGQAAWYPPLAIGVAMLLTLGWRVWPVVLACDLVVSLIQYDVHVVGSAISAVLTAGEAALIVALLHRLRFRSTLERADDVVFMGIATAIATAIGATAGSGLLVATDAVDGGFRATWEVWITGDLTGVVLVLPMLLLAVAHPGTARRTFDDGRGRRLELWTVMGCALALVVVYFVAENPHGFKVEKSGPLMLVLLPTFWIAVRFGLVRTSVYTVAMSTSSVVAYAGLGPHLVHRGIDPPTSIDMVSLMLPLLAVGLAAIGVAAAVEAQDRARQRERTIVDASPVGIITVDTEGVVRSWNAAAERILGIATEEVIGTAPPLLHEIDDFGGAGSTTRRPARRVVHHTRSDGRPIAVKAFTSPLEQVDRRFAGRVVVIEDVTEQEALQRQQALLSTAMDQAGESIVVTDTTPVIIYANPGAVTTSGYSLDELIGANPNILTSGLHDAAFYQRMWVAITSGQAWRGTFINRRKNGELYEESASVSPVHDADGELVAFVSVKHDMSRERALEADVRRSQRDRATVQTIIENVGSDGSVSAIASTLCKTIVDFSDFDAATLLLVQGDESLIPAGVAGAAFDGAGDVVMAPDVGARSLVRLTSRGPWCRDWTVLDDHIDPWTERFRSAGITATAYAAARWERDVFAILLAATTADDGPLLAEQQLGLLDELASFAGVVVGSKVEQARNRDEVRAEIRSIIVDQKFSTAFQPYVDLATGEVRGYEALTRFADGTPPDRRIREAWLVGMGPALEAAVARIALEVADRRLPGVQMSLNFSPDTILNGLAATIVRSASRPVVIEVTEHMAIENYPALRAALHACGDVKVSIDDAGAGFAGLRHILELEPDVVKLDIGLIRGIDHDLARQALAAGLAHYATTSDTLLIAEGIETAEEAATVRRLGVQYAQGYYFGRPEIID